MMVIVIVMILTINKIHRLQEQTIPDLSSRFLNNVYVENLQTSEAWTCEYNNWLSAVFGDRKLLAEIPAVRVNDPIRVGLAVYGWAVLNFPAPMS